MCYNQTGDISTLDGTPLKLVNKFTYLGSSVESTEKDIDTRLTKAWKAINRLLIIWKSDLTDKIKRQFLPGSGRIDTAIWLHYMDANKTAGEEARRQLHKNATSNLEQVLAATPKKTPTVRATCLVSLKLFKLDEPEMQDTAEEAGTNSLVMYSYGPPHMAVQKQDDQHEHTFSKYVRIQDVVQKTCRRRWTIGKSYDRGSGISVLPARHDNDDDCFSTRGGGL